MIKMTYCIKPESASQFFPVIDVCESCETVTQFGSIEDITKSQDTPYWHAPIQSCIVKRVERHNLVAREAACLGIGGDATHIENVKVAIRIAWTGSIME